MTEDSNKPVVLANAEVTIVVCEMVYPLRKNETRRFGRVSILVQPIGGGETISTEYDQHNHEQSYDMAVRLASDLSRLTGFKVVYE